MTLRALWLDGQTAEAELSLASTLSEGFLLALEA